MQSNKHSNKSNKQKGQLLFVSGAILGMNDYTLI